MTKIYVRDLKKYVSLEEAERHRKFSLKKRKDCKGGREHDFVLVLPTYVKKIGALANADEVKMYYDSQERVAEFATVEATKLSAVGIEERYTSFRSRHKRFICSVCKKQEYERT